MPNIINVFNIKTNGLSKNANIDFGTTVQNGHTVNLKVVGANFANGDLSPASSLMINATADPDLADQTQAAFGSPTAPVTNTI
ncbi:spore germination protein [Paenibacillus ehimensis]|uniref:spore germination protein n=1 Tax=Paenibacillus ehimensis TaxID=79264 RepID=UPI00046F368F|nr:spore germination protein [Paenibacillus ehimensis]